MILQCFTTQRCKSYGPMLPVRSPLIAIGAKVATWFEDQAAPSSPL